MATQSLIICWRTSETGAERSTNEWPQLLCRWASEMAVAADFSCTCPHNWIIQIIRLNLTIAARGTSETKSNRRVGSLASHVPAELRKSSAGERNADARSDTRATHHIPQFGDSYSEFVCGFSFAQLRE
jgi:hypothetical protein